MEISLEEIQKKFEGLPEDLKWAIMGAKVDDNIIDIGNAEKLNVEQMGQLSLETYMVMFGFTPPDKFEESVKKSLGLPDEKIRAIVGAVNEKILKEIRKKMMEQTNTNPSQPPFVKGGENEIPLDKGGEGDYRADHDTRVLSSAGIEIINGETSPPAPLLRVAERPGEVKDILAQKLSAPVQAPVIRTEHVPESQNQSGKPHTDPYREVPE